MYRGIRVIVVNPVRYAADSSYRAYINELLSFCGYTRARTAEMELTGKWARIAICMCHWPVGSLYKRPNGQVGLLDHARPKTPRELASLARVHVDLRARAHTDPLSAMAANMDDMEQELRRMKASNDAQLFVRSADSFLSPSLSLTASPPPLLRSLEIEGLKNTLRDKNAALSATRAQHDATRDKLADAEAKVAELTAKTLELQGALAAQEDMRTQQASAVDFVVRVCAYVFAMLPFNRVLCRSA